MWLAVTPVLHELGCRSHVVDLVEVESRRLPDAPSAKRECGDRDDGDHPEVDAGEACTRSGARSIRFVDNAGRCGPPPHHSWLARRQLQQLIAGNSEREGGGADCGDDGGWTVKRLGHRTEIGNPRALEILEREHAPRVDDQHKGGEQGDDAPAGQRGRKCEGQRDRREEVAFVHAGREKKEGDRDQRESGDRSRAVIVSSRPTRRHDRQQQQQRANEHRRRTEAEERGRVASPSSVEEHA